MQTENNTNECVVDETVVQKASPTIPRTCGGWMVAGSSSKGVGFSLALPLCISFSFFFFCSTACMLSLHLLVILGSKLRWLRTVSQFQQGQKTPYVVRSETWKMCIPTCGGVKWVSVYSWATLRQEGLMTRQDYNPHKYTLEWRNILLCVGTLI